MPALQQHIGDGTPMGATVLDDGATFRVWAPRAHSVHVVIDVVASRIPGWTPSDDELLVRRADGTWAGYMPGVAEGAPYRFWVVGDDGPGFKRDPYARELSAEPPFPHSDCIASSPFAYAWRSSGFRPPPFNDLIIYQLHVGSYWAVDENGIDVRLTRGGRFLDLIGRIEYLRDLGVNAVQLLPIQEFPTEFSMGYNGTDLFSPEQEYEVSGREELLPYVELANQLLAQSASTPIDPDEIRFGDNQLKLFVDLCHLQGIAVLFDVVFNHAGGGFDPESLYFLDRARQTSNDQSLYFSNNGWAGGLVFDYASAGVRQFLIDNAVAMLQEYRIDGLRYDEVSVADNFGGWWFCQDVTESARFVKPEAIQIAEYWNDWRWLAVTPRPDGMGFDAAWSDRLSIPVRDALRQASFGGGAGVRMEAIADGMRQPPNFPNHWRAVHSVENHDTVYARSDLSELKPRIALLADPSDARSWWARSRARVATGLLLTAPGIPMLFMGQEVLEEKNWSDNPRNAPGTLIAWDNVASDHAMADHHAFTRDLAWLRRSEPALRSEAINLYHARNDSRILAFHRWLPGSGNDIVVVASLNDNTFEQYRLGFPQPGPWREIFNSDFYDFLPNPRCAGNGGAITAADGGQDGFDWSASVVVPANSVLVFAR